LKKPGTRIIPVFLKKKAETGINILEEGRNRNKYSLRRQEQG